MQTCLLTFFFLSSFHSNNDSSIKINKNSRLKGAENPTDPGVNDIYIYIYIYKVEWMIKTNNNNNYNRVPGAAEGGEESKRSGSSIQGRQTQGREERRP